MLWYMFNSMYRKPPANAHEQSETLMHKTWKSVNLYFSCQADGNHACMHLCVLYMCMCQFLCVCICICICVYWLPNAESKKRKRLRGWRACLFIYYPVASMVSGGHGNTCPGPFSTGLVVACFSPAKAFSSHLSALYSCLFLLFFYPWILLRLSLVLFS